MTWAFEQDIEPHAKLVLLALANRANHETGVCHPGQQLIGRECSMSDRTVRRHLKRLTDAGLVTRRARMLPEGRGRTSDEYRLAYYQPDRMSERSGPTGQKLTTNRTEMDDQPDTVVQGTVREPKENPKIDKRRSSTDRKTGVPDSWQPDAKTIKDLQGKYPKIQITEQIDIFLDYHRSKASKFADWTAAFRNWVRNAEKYRAQSSGDKPGGWR
jgi:DNA-binding transcriptional ArsR family regulator